VEDKFGDETDFELVKVRHTEAENLMGIKRCMSNLVVALNNAMEQWSCFNCDEMKSGALTIAMLINEAVKDRYSNGRLFIAVNQHIYCNKFSRIEMRLMLQDKYNHASQLK